jgi:hypothetical protein
VVQRDKVFRAFLADLNATSRVEDLQEMTISSKLRFVRKKAHRRSSAEVPATSGTPSV